MDQGNKLIGNLSKSSQTQSLLSVHLSQPSFNLYIKIDGLLHRADFHQMMMNLKSIKHKASNKSIENRQFKFCNKENRTSIKTIVG